MAVTKTHTGIVVTKDGEKRVKLRETPTTWCVGRNETYRKEDGRRNGAPLTKRCLKLESIRPIEEGK
ncbi:hypothetical protein [Pectobacterium odoriferum]|uniref:hypothetical protein n=1 Tax=Pectobacterium odoriferum TaxID=78398 RepID=UPI000503F034|nr:hypothetical protein [Pectobacterium odoriferum]KGA30257.1 hypothetical protein KS43_20470 [Pectobacterium odoriferum]